MIYSKGYKFIFDGDPDVDINDLDESQHIFNKGDKIALIENYDWDINGFEIVGEIEFLKETSTYYDDDNCGSVYIPLGNDKTTVFSGEYSVLEKSDVNQINKFFNTNYKEIFTGM